MKKTLLFIIVILSIILTGCSSNDYVFIKEEISLSSFDNITIAGILYYNTTSSCDLDLNKSDCNNATGRYIIG